MIDAILRGVQLRAPAPPPLPREDLSRLRARAEQAEHKRATVARTANGWLSPFAPEVSRLAEDDAHDAPATLALRRRLQRDARTLCRYVLSSPGTHLRAGQVVLAVRATDPVGARGLGCLLYLTHGSGEGARFWWRYAAGIGDSTAAYLLVLDALLRGRVEEARHCYTELDAAGFLCDEDLEPAPARPPTPRRPAPGVLEGYLHDLSGTEPAPRTTDGTADDTTPTQVPLGAGLPVAAP
ncbi:hypothetical protein ACH4PU_32010 [Streptomyces sp. NPDC021100]|uniref:hypothetical protein n=1 Tax=Streptomyces sp. NPDC021100 TaxID=3365114 RepID=UPI00379D4337